MGCSSAAAWAAATPTCGSGIGGTFSRSCGIRDILAKSLGTTNPINMAKATVNGLKNLRRPEDVAKARGLTISQVLPYKHPAAEESTSEPAQETPVRDGGPVEGVRGNREVPPGEPEAEA